MNHRLNPKMIVLARESREVTQIELADWLQISQGKFSKIENGLARVSLHMIKRLIHFLKYPKEFFYEPLDIYPQDYFFTESIKLFHKRLRQKLLLTSISNVCIFKNFFHLLKLSIHQFQNAI
jgi:transcriptional regulator with XRE-family HTH domain